MVKVLTEDRRWVNYNDPGSTRLTDSFCPIVQLLLHRRRHLRLAGGNSPLFWLPVDKRWEFEPW